MDATPGTPRWNLERPFLTGRFHQVPFSLTFPLSLSSLYLRRPLCRCLFAGSLLLSLIFSKHSGNQSPRAGRGIATLLYGVLQVRRSASVFDRLAGR
ncbi:hypothetical protein B296_00053481 [Ensete ventricosum]|uniref:Uncharacterized protein n=1 Tax=Ensete ventricosum TaxID=4639 RepID=A0A426Y815_ENSVE|nr:hypothetical protein B296_00053481 [Ensete ventricosum]